VAANTVMQKVQQEPVVDLTKKTGKIDARRVESARVLLITLNGSSLRAVRPDYFGSLVGPHVSSVKVAEELERRGLLIPRSNRRRTRQIPIPGTKTRKDYYCLLLPNSKVPSRVTKFTNPSPNTD
jgi:hypothetical protein